MRDRAFPALALSIIFRSFGQWIQFHLPYYGRINETRPQPSHTRITCARITLGWSKHLPVLALKTRNTRFYIAWSRRPLISSLLLLSQSKCAERESNIPFKIPIKSQEMQSTRTLAETSNNPYVYEYNDGRAYTRYHRSGTRYASNHFLLDTSGVVRIILLKMCKPWRDRCRWSYNLKKYKPSFRPTTQLK